MPDANPDSRARTVLIVDDADVCANLLEFTLVEIPGVDVVRVASGKEALRLLGDSNIRLCALVTDLNMPQVDGFELIARVRSDRRYAHLPIIVVSADVDPRTPGRVKGLGVEAFFAKPYSPASVRRSLQKLLDAPKLEGPKSA
jgi:CheY-like chemotaxis protein